jgi:peptidoglycan/LPS O-acetylase OafA/YrhL
MSPRTRTSHRWRVRLHLLSACTGGLLLFGFSVLHGINNSDPSYITELLIAWSAAALGIYSGIYTLKRGHRKQRVAAVLALALIGCSMVVVTFLNRSPDPSSPPARPADFLE